MGVPDYATGPGSNEPHGPFLLDYPGWKRVVRDLMEAGHENQAMVVLKELDRQTGETQLTLDLVWDKK